MGEGIDPEVETFEGMGTKKHEVTSFPEYDIVNGPLAFDVDEGRPSPPLENGSVHLPKAPLRVTLDPQRLEHIGGKPGQFCPSVNEDRIDWPPWSWANRILDLDSDAEGAHVGAHTTS